MSLRISLVYLHVCGLNADADPNQGQVLEQYHAAAERFVRTYKEFPAGIEHDLLIVRCNGIIPDIQIYDGIQHRIMDYNGTGWCSGAHQRAAQVSFADFMVFCCARTHFWKVGWLKRFVEAREQFGDGFYGSMAGEGTPHLRTNFYGLNPKVLADYPHPLDSRLATHRLESLDWNLSKQFYDEGKPSKLVTWDGTYDLPEWRTPKNGFRMGNQSDCLVLDRHSSIFGEPPKE